MAITLNNLALIKLCQGKLYEAMQLFEESLRLANINYELNKGFIATTLSNLSIVNRDLGNYSEAFETINKAIDITKEEYGEESIYFARCINNLGYILYLKKDYVEAQKKYKQAIKIDENFYGEKHPEVARKKANLATCLIKLNKFDDAEELLNYSTKVIEEAFGKKSIQLSDSLNSLGMILEYRDNEIEKAIIKFREARIMAIDILGNIHPLVSTYTWNLALALEKAGTKTEVLKLYKESLNIDEKIYGKEHEYTIEKLQTIAKYLYEIKEYKKARKYAIDASRLNSKNMGNVVLK